MEIGQKKALCASALQDTVVHAPFPILWVGMDGVCTFANDAACDYFGYTSDEITSFPVHTICPAYTADTFQSLLEALRQSKTLVLDTENRCKDGTVKSAQATVSLSDTCDCPFIIVTLTETTILKKHISELLFLKNVLDLSTDAVFLVDAATLTVAYANKRASLMLGYTQDELTGMPVDTFRTPYETNSIMVQDIPATLKKSNQTSVFATLRRKNGSLFHVESNLTRFQRDDKEYFIAVSRDITERLHLERELNERQRALEEFNTLLEDMVVERTQELERSEQRYRTYISIAPDPIFVSDIHGRYVEVNEAACDLFGYTEEELLKLSIPDVLHPDDLRAGLAHFSTLQITGRAEGTFRLRTKDGHVRYMSVNAVRIDGERLMAICKDLTQEVEMAHTLKELNSSLKQRVEEEIAKRQKQEEMFFEQKKLADMGQMINAIAHQWRQPINALGLYVQDILDAFDAGEVTREYIAEYERCAMDLVKHMSATIDDFKSFFTPDKEMVSFSVPHEIQNLVNLMSAQLQSKGIEVSLLCECVGETTESKPMVGFVGEFKQAIVNILYNAVDAIDEAVQKGKRGKPCITVGVKDEGDMLRIRIADTGTGIPEKVMTHIFEPYYTTKGDTHGTGIGLYMTKMVIEKHMNGRISAENTPEGAQFTIRIPYSGTQK